MTFITLVLIGNHIYFPDGNQIQQQHFGVARHGLPIFEQLNRNFSGAHDHNYRHDTENGR
jgi:hypothetical protein